jgi:hypothetical protein
MRDCTEKSHLDFNNFWETVKELERLLDYTFICSGSLRGANDMPYVKEALDNRAEPRDNASVIAGGDWVHGRQAAWIR